MNGVSHMIPFVVVGGLLLAVSIALGGHSDPEGHRVRQGLVLVLRQHPRRARLQADAADLLRLHRLRPGDRPALVPGMIGGFLAYDGMGIYGADANAGFLGAIATGFLAGYLVLWIRKVKVPKFVQPIMPIIVIPIVSTLALGMFYIYVIGAADLLGVHAPDELAQRHDGVECDRAGRAHRADDRVRHGRAGQQDGVPRRGAGLDRYEQRRHGHGRRGHPGHAARPGAGHAAAPQALQRAGAGDRASRRCSWVSSASPKVRFRSPRRGLPRSFPRTCSAARWPVRSPGWPGWRTPFRTAGRSCRCSARWAERRCSSLAIAIGTAVTALTTNALIDVKSRRERGRREAPAALVPEPVPVGVGSGGRCWRRGQWWCRGRR